VRFYPAKINPQTWDIAVASGADDGYDSNLRECLVLARKVCIIPHKNPQLAVVISRYFAWVYRQQRGEPVWQILGKLL
jgi:hypothetical protein